jgi:hypothetical protein
MSNRPVTNEEFEKLAESFDESEGVPDFMKVGPLRIKFREMFAAGSWLDKRLEEAGCVSPEERADQCFASGQMSMSCDPWIAAKRVLSGYVQDDPVKPGDELAKEIFGE